MEILQNRVLHCVLVAWLIAQSSKPFIQYLRTREWGWHWFFSAGGMPSTHSAVIVAATTSIGALLGFDSPVFALSVAICMIVLYDAAGVRRQAGEHARVINAIIDDLAHGHPLKEENLKELLGHTPGEVIVGTVVGVTVAVLMMADAGW
ncbi:MAG: divergent PAP2 family protein [Anaerolineales bacterium]|nr:divergent PAP2 family protein [Anaerolineales bacterium]